MTKRSRFLSPLHKAVRQIELWFTSQLAGTDLSPQDAHLLTYLAAYAPCPVGDLVRVFDLRGSTATSVLDRLERLGLVERRPNPADRRSSLVSLTEKGSVTAAFVQSLLEKFESALSRRVSARATTGFYGVLAAISEATGVTVVRRNAVSPPSSRRAGARGRTGSS